MNTHVCMYVNLCTFVLPKLLDAQNHGSGVWQVHLQYRQPLLLVHPLLRLEDLCWKGIPQSHRYKGIPKVQRAPKGTKGSQSYKGIPRLLDLHGKFSRFGSF